MKRIFSLTALLLCFVTLLSSMGIVASAAEFTGDDRIVIVLDPGHGTAGEPSEYNYSEGSYNMRTAKYMKAALEANSSFVVYLTNEASNVDLSHYERAVFADSVNADLMISVHYNSSPNPDLCGMEAWSSVIPKFDTAAIAKMCVDYGVAAVPALYNGGVNQRKDNAGFYWDEEYQWDIEGASYSGVLSDYYGIITWGLKFGVPTFILEEMYLSSEYDRALASDANIKAIAEAQAQAIIDYYTAHTHTYGEVQTDIPLSCITPGKQSEHCTVCGHRRNITTVADAPDATAHFYRPVDVNDPDGAWTCVYTHSLINKAKLTHEHHTGDSLSGVTLPPYNATAPVTPTEPVTPDEPTPEVEEHVHDYKVTSGYERQYAILTCECGAKNRIEPLSIYDCEAGGHLLMPYSLFDGFEALTAEDTVVSCEVDGKKFSFCLACGAEEYDVTPAYGHDYKVVNEVAPTCEELGKIEKHCETCAKRIVEDVPVVGHTFVNETIPADCENEGKQIERCVTCNKENAVSIPVSGHLYQAKVTTEPSAVGDGERESTCTVCGDSYTESIPSKGVGAMQLSIPIDLPLPIIAFIVLIILLVAAVIVVPVIIRRRRAAEVDEEDIPIEAMDFKAEDVKLDEERKDADADADESVDLIVTDEAVEPQDLMPDEFTDENGVVAEIIPEIAQVIVTEEAEDIDPDQIAIPVEEPEENGDEAREEALDALKRSFEEE